MEKRIAELEQRLEKLGAAGRSAPPRARRSPPERGPSRLRHAEPQRARYDLEHRRRRPDLLALDLDRQRHRRVDLDASPSAPPPPSGGARARPCRSSAPSSGSRASRRRRSGRRRTARRRAPRPARASSRRRARRRSRRSRRASGRAAPSVVEAHDDLRVLPLEEDARERVEERRACPPSTFDIPFARCATAPLMPTEPTFANHRSAGSSGPRAVGDAAGVDRPRRPVERRRGRRRRTCAGSRRCGRSPCRCRAGSSPARRRDPRRRSPTSFSVPSPPTATTSVAPPSTAARASSIRWPGRSEKSVSPLQPELRCAVRQLGPALARGAVVDAGLTRKTVSVANAEMATSSAIRVMRSTAARRSSSEMRVNSPSTTMSLTVSRQPASTPRSAPTREERGRLHLDREHAALRPALVLARRPGCRRGRSRRSARRAAPGRSPSRCARRRG